MSGAAAAYAQLLALGMPWVAVHCGAMCGPIAAGLTANVPRKSDRIRGIGAYQVGRALVYVPLGAVAGTVGHAVEVRPVVGAAAGLALAAALVVAAWIPAASTESLVPVARLVRRAGANGPIARALSAARRLLASGVVFPLGAAGFVLGALPCMLPAWVLGLAAGAGSALHGAALMALLLAMNTGPLALAAALLPGATRGRLAVLLPRSAMSLSALWLTLGALASLHLLPHGRAVVFGRTITFW